MLSTQELKQLIKERFPSAPIEDCEEKHYQKYFQCLLLAEKINNTLDYDLFNDESKFLKEILMSMRALNISSGAHHLPKDNFNKALEDFDLKNANAKYLYMLRSIALGRPHPYLSAEIGDIKTINKLLNYSTGRPGALFSCIVYASRGTTQQHIDVVHKLIHSLHEKNILDDVFIDNETPLCNAIYNNNIQLINMLIAHGATITKQMPQAFQEKAFKEKYFKMCVQEFFWILLDAPPGTTDYAEKQMQHHGIKPSHILEYLKQFGTQDDVNHPNRQALLERLFLKNQEYATGLSLYLEKNSAKDKNYFKKEMQALTKELRYTKEPGTQTATIRFSPHYYAQSSSAQQKATPIRRLECK